MGAGSRSADHAGRRFRRYPKDWDTEGIFYNKTYFAAHHIQIPANLTWNPVNGGSFLALARQATIDNPAGIAAQAKFSFGVLPIPTGPDGRWSFTNGLIDAINVHSPNQTAAWELEQWL